MKISIGADHRGFEHKNFIIQQFHLDDTIIAWNDVGCFAPRCDYPVFADAVVQDILAGNAELGILLCASGIGMSIAANRFKGIYAGLVWNKEVAALARQDDNSNVLVLPSDFVSPKESLQIIQSWLTATFKGGKYQERIDMVDQLG